MKKHIINKTYNMKHNSLIPQLSILAVVLLFLSSCELAGDLVGFGMYLGIAIVIAVIALVIFIIRRMGK
ncbi:MAG: hypothetical protein WKF97_00435 [Chitinophagaceae bacterium]